jgi:beta-lactamase regulating signal transducer with metallopeptidase domain
VNTVLAWIVEGTAVAVIAALALQLMPRSSASARHLFCWLALLIVAAWPVWGAVLSPVVAEQAGISLSAAPDTSADGGASHSQGGAVGSRPTPTARFAVLLLPPVPEPLLRAITTVWLSVMSVALMRLLLAWHELRQLTRAATPFPSALVKAMGHWEATRRRPARLLVSDRIDGACAVGFWRPSILVSSRLVATLDLTSLESLVLHEQAHLQRGDDWLRLIQQIVLALAGLHPAVWWMSRQIDHEREAACDREVVARTGAPLPYARALARIAAAARRSSWHVALAPAAILDRAGLARRVERLLEAAPVSRVRLSTGAAAAATALVGAVASLSYLPPFVLIAAPSVEMAAAAGVPVASSIVQPSPALNVVVPAVVARAEQNAVLLSVPVGAASGAPQVPVAAPIAPTVASGQTAGGAGTEASSTIEVPAAAAVSHDADERIADTPQEPVTVLAPPADPPMAAAVLDTTALPILSRPIVLSAAEESDGIAQPFIDTGRGVARAGAATGDAVYSASVATTDAVSRAGQSIGRFFKGQSLTVARQF